MPIYYSLVARGQNILCDASREHGNFRLVAQKIIAKIPQYDAKMSYVYEKFVSLQDFLTSSFILLLLVLLIATSSITLLQIKQYSLY